MEYRNVWTDTLWLEGVPYPPGATIPATSDPAQLRHFEALGVVQPSTAPAALPETLRRISLPEAVTLKEASDGDDGAE